QPGLAGVGEQEGVVVAGAVGRERWTALPMRLDQRRDHLERLARVAPALEAEAHEVHPDQARALLDRLVREQHLVADGDAVAVDTVLEAPDPPRRMAEHAIGLGDLRDLDVRAAQHRARRVHRLRELEQRLALARLAVAVLREERDARGGLGGHRDERVAHRCKGTRWRRRPGHRAAYASSTVTVPAPPSTRSRWPLRRRRLPSSVETTPGIPISRATSAAWLKAEPASITTAPATRKSGAQLGSVAGATSTSPASKSPSHAAGSTTTRATPSCVPVLTPMPGSTAPRAPASRAPAAAGFSRMPCH